jgi:hypothetical protein
VRRFLSWRPGPRIETVVLETYRGVRVSIFMIEACQLGFGGRCRGDLLPLLFLSLGERLDLQVWTMILGYLHASGVGESNVLCGV